jgi:riboflavin biosynthesis pyrimidine reductase
VRQLFPDLVEPVEPDDAYAGRAADPPAGRPYVVVNMVSSVDGATTVGGVSGGLGGAADRRVFLALRGLADAVLVGAQTVRAEGYGPPRLDPAAVQRRQARGQPPLPRIAVVSRSLGFDWSSALFADGATRPIVLAPAAADPAGLDRARERADVVVAGRDTVDLAEALAALARLGTGRVLCEGGPTLAGTLVAGGLVDELCLTLSPTLVGGAGARILNAPGVEVPFGLALVHVLEQDGFLFLRYARPGPR